MSTKLSEDNFELQNKLNDAAAMAVNLLSPNSVVTKLLRDFAGGYRNRIYTPSVTVWMFIGQILSKDHGSRSCEDSALHDGGRLGVGRHQGLRSTVGEPVRSTA